MRIRFIPCKDKQAVTPAEVIKQFWTGLSRHIANSETSHPRQLQSLYWTILGSSKDSAARSKPSLQRERYFFFLAVPSQSGQLIQPLFLNW